MSIPTLLYYAWERTGRKEFCLCADPSCCQTPPLISIPRDSITFVNNWLHFLQFVKLCNFAWTEGHCPSDPQSSLTKFKLYHLHQRGWWWLATYLSCSAAALDGRMPSCGEPPADGENCMYLPAISNLCPVSNSTLPLLDFYRPPIAIRSFNSLHSSATTATRTSPTQFPRFLPSFLPSPRWWPKSHSSRMNEQRKNWCQYGSKRR